MTTKLIAISAGDAQFKLEDTFINKNIDRIIYGVILSGNNLGIFTINYSTFDENVGRRVEHIIYMCPEDYSG